MATSSIIHIHVHEIIFFLKFIIGQRLSLREELEPVFIH